MRSALKKRLRRILIRALALSAVAAVPVAYYYYANFHHVRRAVALLQAGDNAAAKEELREHFAAHPADTATRIEFSKILRADKEYAAAADLLAGTPNLERCPGDACRLARRLRVAALLELERLHEAEAALAAAEAADPGPESCELRYRLLRLREDASGAAAALAKCLVEHPDAPGLNIVQAREEALAGDAEGGARRPSGLAERSPREARPQILTALGSLHETAGDQRAAEAAYRAALGENDEYLPAHDALTVLYLTIGKSEASLRHALRAIALEPKGLLIRYHYAGRMAVQLGDWALAERLFTQLRDLSPLYRDLAASDFWLLRRAKAQAGAPPPATVSVTFRVSSEGPAPERLFIAGGWRENGSCSDLEGWRYEPMESADGKTWTRTAALDPRNPFGYGFVLDDDRDPANGALYFDRLALPLMESFPPSISYDIRLRPGEEERPAPTSAWRPAPADGRQSLFVLWLDGGSWHVLAPLLMRGRAPAIQRFLEGAAYGALWAQKAWTAKAIQALTTFSRAENYTLVNLASDVVREMQANAAVGRYFRFVSPATLTYLEGQTNLSIWDAARRSRKVALNMIFSDRGVFDPNDAALFDASGERVRLTDLVDAAPQGAALEYDEETLAILARFLGAPPEDRSRGFMHRYIVSNYRDALQKQKLATEAIRRYKPEFTVLRYPELDHVSHFFFDSRRQTIPGDPPTTQPPGFESVLENFYTFYDELLGETLSLADEDDVVFLISDHGMASNFDHGPLAILAARGPAIAARGYIGRFDNHDFPKTILRLAGISVPEAPSYQVIEALFDPAAGTPGPFERGASAP